MGSFMAWSASFLASEKITSLWGCKVKWAMDWKKLLNCQSVFRGFPALWWSLFWSRPPWKLCWAAFQLPWPSHRPHHWLKVVKITPLKMKVVKRSKKWMEMDLNWIPQVLYPANSTVYGSLEELSGMVGDKATMCPPRPRSTKFDNLKQVKQILIEIWKRHQTLRM